MSEKRFQECNWLEKVWRYRFYAPIPFKYIWFTYFKPIKINGDDIINDELVYTDKFITVRGKNLWRILLGTSQIKMKWYYTSDEVKKTIEDKFKNYTNGVK